MCAHDGTSHCIFVCYTSVSYCKSGHSERINLSNETEKRENVFDTNCETTTWFTDAETDLDKNYRYVDKRSLEDSGIVLSSFSRPEGSIDHAKHLPAIVAFSSRKPLLCIE